MLFTFGSYEKQKEITNTDFKPDYCPSCNTMLKIMESSRYFSFMYFLNFKTETLGYYYLCPECNTEYSNQDINKLKEQQT